MIALPRQRLCRNYILPRAENHYGFFLSSVQLHYAINQKFFLSYSVYLRYREMYGMILGDLKMLKTEDFNTLEPCLAEESPLHLCGYTVAERMGLLAEDRQGVIAFVINRGIMGKEEVVSHLAWLIDTNEHRENMDRAIMKWKEDLDYALAYDMEGQAKYIISQLERYRPNQFEVHQ